MDPLTLAAERFIREHETAWVPPPGAKHGVPGVLRLGAKPGQRGDALKSLRLLECRPENRRPVSIVEVPFRDALSYATAIGLAVRADVAKVDAGLREDGITRPDTPVVRNTETPEILRAELTRLASHLAMFLEGLVVVLAPAHVADEPALASFLARLADAGSGSALRIDALIPDAREVARALPIVASFELDEDELFSYMRDLGTRGSQGPLPEGPTLSPAQRIDVEKRLGQPIASLDAGRTLKRLFMDGGKALAEGKHADAIRRFRVARSLAQVTGLRGEELVASMALGSAYAGTSNHRGALASYERARRLAETLGRADLSAQALFGIGYIHMIEKRFGDSAVIYRAIVLSLPDDSPLRREARRLSEAALRHDPSYGLDGVLA